MKKHNKKNIYLYLLLKVLLAFGTLLLMQIVFHLANLRIFHLQGFGEWASIAWGNIVFGAATIATFFAPYIIMQLLPLRVRWKRWYRILSETLYILPILILLIPRGANMAYYQYTYRLLSSEIFSYLGIGGQMGSLIPHFAIDYWYAWVLPVAIFLLFLMLNKRIILAPRSPYSNHMGNGLIVLGIGLLLLWFAARGGFGHFIRPSDAAHYCQPKNTALVNNDTYNILRTLFSPDIEEVRYMDDAQAQTLFPALHRPTNTIATTDSLHSTQPNIVILIIESLGQEFMGCYNTQPEADTRTPFLDSLAQHCTLYDGRSNGKKSIEGITAISTSIPNLMSIPLTNSPYANQPLPSLASLLRSHGYHTAFFHGSYNGVMAFDSTCTHIGFNDYLGKNEYEASPYSHPDDYDGTWGIFDEPFLHYTAHHLSTYTQPFFAEIFTVTSHHPFPLPEKYKDRFPEGRHPILKCVEYTDHSLRQFFAQASQQPWYNNTLFIILGDHSGHGLTPEYNDYDGWYRIPMMVFDPQHPIGRRDPRIVQQIDLFPTLADRLGLPDTFPTFGQSIISQPSLGHYIYYANGYHVMVSNNPTNPTIHDLTLIMGDYEQGTPDNLALLRAIIQRYNHKVITLQLAKP